MEAYIYPIKSAEGVIDEIVVMHDDVTERTQAEATLRFLAETSSALLTTALDYEATVKKAAELAMRQLGGWCAIHMLEATKIRLAAVAHQELDKADQLTRLWQDARPLEELGYGPVRVVRTGEPELRRECADILKSQKKQAAAEDALQQLAGATVKSYLSIPLRQRGEVIGALTLLSADRFYSSEDLALAQELADRAALALQNARLYDQSQRAITTHKLLAETMLQGVVRQDSTGTIISMNPAAERILGKTREGFLGSSSVNEEHHTIREDGSPFPGWTTHRWSRSGPASRSATSSWACSIRERSACAGSASTPYRSSGLTRLNPTRSIRSSQTSPSARTPRPSVSDSSTRPGRRRRGSGRSSTALATRFGSRT